MVFTHHQHLVSSATVGLAIDVDVKLDHIQSGYNILSFCAGSGNTFVITGG